MFGIVGATFLDVLDALYDDRSVEYITRYDEYARLFGPDETSSTPIMSATPGAGRARRGQAGDLVEIPIDTDREDASGNETR